MKAKCHAEHDANHCTGFSGGGVAPGGELRSGCFRACSPDLLVKGIVLDAGGDCRAYYWEEDATDAVVKNGGWAVLVVPGNGRRRGVRDRWRGRQ